MLGDWMYNCQIKQKNHIKIFSCFSFNCFDEFYCIKNTMNANCYHYILQYKKIRKSDKKLFNDGEFIFQHDNDPKYTAYKN